MAARPFVIRLKPRSLSEGEIVRKYGLSNSQLQSVTKSLDVLANKRQGARTGGAASSHTAAPSVRYFKRAKKR